MPVVKPLEKKSADLSFWRVETTCEASDPTPVCAKNGHCARRQGKKKKKRGKKVKSYHAGLKTWARYIAN